MRVSATRSVKRHAHLPFVPPGRQPRTRAPPRRVGLKRSRRAYGDGSLDLAPTASLLQAAWRDRFHPGTPQALGIGAFRRRVVSSSFYLASRRVDGREQALHHYDPLRHGLELLRPLGPAEDGGALTPYRNCSPTVPRSSS